MPNLSKNQKYLLRIEKIFAQDDKYKILHLNNNPKGWKVSKSEKGKEESTSFLPATNEEIFHINLLKSVL